MFHIDAEKFEKQTGLVLTHHAWLRMNERNISLEAVCAAIRYGRRVHIRGAVTHAIGRKEIAQAKNNGIDLSGLNGIQVVCSSKGSTALTVYRNPNFRGLRPNRRRSFKRATSIGSKHIHGAA